MTTTLHHPDPLQLCEDFVHNTSRHIFLTGKAGTGKTTFLKSVVKTCNKNLVVVAPTGVAAINAGGVTAHSFFQIPPGTFSPKPLRRGFQSHSAIIDRHSLLENQRLNNEKRELIQSLELIIIDEVSMMRCDLLDAIDTVLRAIRKSSAPFGGVQMLFIGDLYQLPPVAKQGEWDLVSEHYASPFFFAAQALKGADLLLIELTNVYRQRDERFIHLLNRIRDNVVDDRDLDMLRSLYQPDLRPKPEEHFITLTTHNHKADEINARELARIRQPEMVSMATVEGDFPDRNFPVESTLRLKPGAQVMFVRNDTEDKKYFNGKIGVVKSVEEDEEDDVLVVEFPETGDVIRVGKEVWHNIRYSFDEQEQKIKEEQLGLFRQFPVRLAWAVTIHKSQGLTFEKVVIDAGNAFAAGQVYVALSRCVSMEGIILLSRINNHVIMTDPSVVEYMRAQTPVNELRPVLDRDKQRYVISRAVALFDMMPLITRFTEFVEYMGERKFDGKEEVISRLHEIHDAMSDIETVAEKFRNQVHSLTALHFDGDLITRVNERMTKGKAWFENELDQKLNTPLATIAAELQLKRKVRKAMKEMKSFMLYADHFTARFSNDPGKRKKVEVPTPSRKPDGDTKTESFKLFQSGKSVAEISALRGLTVGTIEGHLAHFVRIGELDVLRLISEERFDMIREAIKRTSASGLNPVKAQLGDDVTYSEIRFVMSAVRRETVPDQV